VGHVSGSQENFGCVQKTHFGIDKRDTSADRRFKTTETKDPTQKTKPRAVVRAIEHRQSSEKASAPDWLREWTKNRWPNTRTDKTDTTQRKANQNSL
jgi:hypothetical protein